MNETKFKDMSYTIAQIGFYLMSLGDISLYKDSEMHRNIILLLTSMAATLNENMNKGFTKAVNNKDTQLNTEQFLTKKEVIQAYYPLFTEYGLTQAIHKQDIPYHKRGAKYFFKKSEVDAWINNNSKQERSKKNYQFV